MLHQPTLEKLEAMRLDGMAQAWRELANSEQAADLSFEERMALLVDRQFTWRQNEAFQARRRRAKLRSQACVEDIDYRAARGLDKALVRSLASESSWVERHENVFVCAPTGMGKSYLACALAHKACRDGYSAFYMRAAALFRDLARARADGSLRNFLLRLSKIDVLVVDDWAMTPLSESEVRHFWEICEGPQTPALSRLRGGPASASLRMLHRGSKDLCHSDQSQSQSGSQRRFAPTSLVT